MSWRAKNLPHEVHEKRWRVIALLMSPLIWVAEKRDPFEQSPHFKTKQEAKQWLEAKLNEPANVQTNPS